MGGKVQTWYSFVAWTTFRYEISIVGDVLEMMCPYHEGLSASTSSKVIVSRMCESPSCCSSQNLPSILYYELEVVSGRESNGCLYVIHSSSVDTDGRDTALFAR